MRGNPHWIALRRFCFNRGRGRCERCRETLKAGAWHLHHLFYSRQGHELPEDVLALCLTCHNDEHPRHTMRSADEIRKRRILRRGNRAKRKPWPEPDEAWYAINGKHLEKLELVRGAR